MQLFIAPGGVVRSLYDETLDLACLGSLSIARASHVESTADGFWTADLRPANGPVLGPFQLRSQALDAERAWLERRLAQRAPDSTVPPSP